MSNRVHFTQSYYGKTASPGTPRWVDDSGDDQSVTPGADTDGSASSSVNDVWLAPYDVSVYRGARGPASNARSLPETQQINAGPASTADLSQSAAQGLPEAKQFTTTSAGTTSVSQSSASPSSATYGSPGGLQIVVNYDASVGSAPAALQAAFAAAAGYFTSTFANPITITLDVGWGEIAGQPLSSGALGESESYLLEESYQQLTAALAGDTSSPDQMTAAASLPATNPTGGTFWATTAESKALSLLTGYTGVDGYVGFGSGYSWDFTDAPPTAGQYDFIAVAEHEISEVLGRDALLGETIGGVPNSYSPLDLFRYSGSGQRSLVGGQTAYFSIDGGQTNLNYFNTNSGGDWGDWSSSGTTSAGRDAYDAFAGTGSLYALSPNDKRELNVLGYTLNSAAPTVTEALVSDTGASATDRITNNPTVGGTADPNATVVVSDSGTVIGSAAADINGDWSFAPVGLSEGVHTLVASETNASGYTGSAALIFTLDTTAPTVTEALAFDTGASSTDLITSKSTVTGRADASAKVTISEGGTLLGTVTTNSSGIWSFSPSGLVNGVHTLVASESDLAGNVGTASLTFTLDTIAPKVTEKLLSDTGLSSTDRITMNPAVTGTGDPNALVTISQGGVALGTTSADPFGNWTFAPLGLTDGSHTLVASETDLAGNTGTASLIFTLDTTPPVPTARLATDTGASSTDGLTNNPMLTGTADPSALIALSEAGKSYGSVRASSTGTWSLTPSGLVDGAHTILVSETDLAGNIGSTSVGFTLDKTAPKVTEKLLSDTGLSSADRITMNPAVTGTGDPNALVTISQGGVALGTTSADPFGNWTFAPLGLTDGSHTLVASETDLAGNIGTASLIFTLDTTPPNPPNVPQLGSALGAGLASSNDVLATASPSFTGTAEANTTVRLYDGTTQIGTAKANAQGVWVIASSALAIAQHTITATATDAAGNLSGTSATASVTALSNAISSFTYADDNVNLEIGGQKASASFGNGTVFLSVGAGSDTLLLGNGNDTLVLGGTTTTTDTITLGNGNDTVGLAAGKSNVTAGTGADEFMFGSPQGELILNLGSTDELVFRNSAFNLGLDNGKGTATPQPIDSSLFSVNTDGTFAASGNRLAYDQSTGNLWYDQYGSASPSSATLVGNFPNLPGLAANNLFFTS